MSKEIEKDKLFKTEGDKELRTLEEELEKLEEEKEKNLEEMDEEEADPFDEVLPEVLRIDQEDDMISPDEIEKTLYTSEEQRLMQEEKEGSDSERTWDFNRDPIKVMPDYDKGVLTIEKHTDFKPEDYKEEIAWHELQYAYYSKTPLSGVLSGIEPTKEGFIAVLYYKSHRVLIPVKEMNLKIADDNPDIPLAIRLVRVINSMIGAEIDFIVMGLVDEMKSAIGSRAKAMEFKRRRYYFPNNVGFVHIEVGRIVEGRVMAVGDKMIRLEAFGAECVVHAKNLGWEWVSDARTHYSIGDRVQATITSIEADEETGDVSIEVDMRELKRDEAIKALKNCMIKGSYFGEVTDVHKGGYFINLVNHANAYAHKSMDHKYVGRGDKVLFVVRSLDFERGLAKGLITRIIRQDL